MVSFSPPKKRKNLNEKPARANVKNIIIKVKEI